MNDSQDNPPRCTCDARTVPGANHVAPCALYDAEEDAAIQRDRAGRLVGANLRLERRVVELEAALRDAIEFADEGWSYASPYFVEKWDYKGQREKLRVALKPEP